MVVVAPYVYIAANAGIYWNIFAKEKMEKKRAQF